LPSDSLLRDPLENAAQQRRRLEQDDDADDLDEGWKITERMMNAMDKSEWLKKELQDGGLRQVIYEIDSASNIVGKDGYTQQEKALEQAKTKYPNLSTFLDKLLVVTGVLERQEQEEEESLEEWLERHGGREESLGPLVLASIQRKPRLDTDEPSSDSSDAEASDDNEDSSSSSAETSSTASNEEGSDTDSSSTSG